MVDNGKLHLYQVGEERVACLAGKHCYIPLVEDSNSNMSLLHIGKFDELQLLIAWSRLIVWTIHIGGQDRRNCAAMQAQHPSIVMLLGG